MKNSKNTNLKPLVFSALFAALTAAVSPIKIPLGFTPVPITLQTLMVLLSGAMLGPYYGALAMILYVTVGALGLPVFAGGSSGIEVLFGPTGGYLLSYFIAAFVVGLMVRKKNITAFLKYLSFAVILFLVFVVIIDLTLKLGILKFGDKAMVLTLSEFQRILFLTLSLILTAFLLSLAFFMKSSKKIPLDTILAMFSGTLIIYLFGSLQGKLVTGLPWNAIFVGWVLPFIIGDTIKLIAAAYISKSINIQRFLR